MAEKNRRMDLGLAPKMIKDIPVDLKNATQTICECGCKYFIPAMTIHIVSALLSPIGKELAATQPALVCMECKKPWEVKEG